MSGCFGVQVISYSLTEAIEWTILLSVTPHIKQVCNFTNMI